MFLRLLKGNKPGLIILIPLFMCLVWLKTFLQPGENTVGNENFIMPLYKLLHSSLGENNILRKIIALVLLIINSLWLVRLNTKFILIKTRTYLPALFYAFICSSFIPLQDLTPALIASTFFIFTIELMFDSYKDEKLSYKFFEAALLVSIGSLFYAKISLFMTVIWISLILLRPGNWREWMYSFIGFLLPYLFLISIYYLTDQDMQTNITGILSNFNITRGFEYFNRYYFVFYLFLFFLLIVSSIKLIGIYQGLKIYIRKYFKVFFWIFVAAMTFYFAAYNNAVELIYFSTVPVAYIFTYYFISARSKTFLEILFTIFLGLLVGVLVLN